MKKLIVAGLVVAGAALAGDAMMPKSTYTMPADLKWEQPYGPQGPAISVVSGDPKTGPYTMFLKMAPGSDSGWHIHDHTYVATVIKGTATAQAQGDAAETKLPVGAYFSEPGKKVHRNGCTKESECIVFVHSMGAMSTTMTTPDGKPLPPPAVPAAGKEMKDMKKK
jgi:quercetin dioxygenase-like cupin family protein